MKKRNKVISSLCILVVFLLSIGFIFLKPDKELENYRKYSNTFTEIPVKDIDDKVADNDNFILFVGRETCPYCRKFVPKLYKASEKLDKKIFYLNTISSENTKNDLKQFSEINNLNVVPALLVYENGESHSLNDIDSEKITVDEIYNFLK